MARLINKGKSSQTIYWSIGPFSWFLPSTNVIITESIIIKMYRWYLMEYRLKASENVKKWCRVVVQELKIQILKVSSSNFNSIFDEPIFLHLSLFISNINFIGLFYETEWIPSNISKCWAWGVVVTNDFGLSSLQPWKLKEWFQVSIYLSPTLLTGFLWGKHEGWSAMFTTPNAWKRSGRYV